MSVKKFTPSLYILLSSLLAACSNPPETATPKTDFTAYVNPFVGTSKMGHVFPGATAPFGMVQLSPQTNWEPMFLPDGSYNTSTYEYCAGYQYRDSTILGFAHTNFSGTGHSDLGDFLVMPTTGALILEPLGDSVQPGFASGFSHEREEAHPGYYRVHLDRYGIEAEMTATERVGVHRYTPEKKETLHLLLDLVYNVYQHEDKNVWTFVRVENDTLVTGFRQTHGWARTRILHFAMSFNKPMQHYGHRKYDQTPYNGFYRRFNESENFPEMAGHNLRAWFNFAAGPDDPLLVKMALSSVSTEGALNNLKTEVPDWDFNRVRAETKEKWNRELGKVEVETLTEADKTTFYTALYHSCLSPIVYEDTDGSYRGLDQNIHRSEGFTNYTVFSLWDTYRALHPWFNLTQPGRNNDMIKSMLAHQEQSVHHMLPVWSHHANENWCMIGYHAVSVLADAMAKDVGDFDRSKAFRAALTTSNVRYFEGIGDYLDHRYVPDDRSHSSVSKTLEYAYDDWCIAQMAKQLNQPEFEKAYRERAGWYRNLYDPAIGFMRPKLADGNWRPDFDPMDTHGQGFIEGNAWNYGLYVPQDLEAMVEMMGGRDRMTRKLDSLFTMEIEEKYIEKNEDITRDGIIGNYVHGNEPGHHIPYLYNWTGHPEKTQARVRMICRTMYGPGVEGLCGNDDAGQMSAWYLFSALGFYPVTPGSAEYAIGSPLVKSAVIHLENGNTLRIHVENQSEKNVYVKSVILNGQPITGHTLDHRELVKGCELVFVMTGE